MLRCMAWALHAHTVKFQRIQNTDHRTALFFFLPLRLLLIILNYFNLLPGKSHKLFTVLLLKDILCSRMLHN